MQIESIPECWRTALAGEFDEPYFQELTRFVQQQRRDGEVYPPPAHVFHALGCTPLKSVRVLLLGQDPYHGPGQAHGLSFSVPSGIRIPPSLRNIFAELSTDLGVERPQQGCLEPWARQGVLLLNTVLTVGAGAANSHRRRGWETFTDRIIDCVNEQSSVAFVLWGKPAQQKAARIDDRHLLIASPHPSPLSAHRGFFGSRPFSQINEYLKARGLSPIDWMV